MTVMIKETKSMMRALNAWTQSQQDLDSAKSTLNVAVYRIQRHCALNNGDKDAKQFAAELKIELDAARLKYKKALDCEKQKQIILKECKRKLNALILSHNNKED